MNIIQSTDETIVFLKGLQLHRNEQEILDQIDLKIRKGEFIYLVGKTGAGKSTLLKVLYQSLPFRGETGLVAGFNLTSLPPARSYLLRRKLGIIFQDFVLLPDRDVHDNLIFALKASKVHPKKSWKDRIQEVLEAVDLSGYQNRSVHQLSGGEQQRVAIARALLNKPELIIADEPTGNLDPDTSDEIIELLRKICRERSTAILMATHDYRIINNYPARILRMHNGKLYE
jgi:cell division transport system ATP-binding protein